MRTHLDLDDELVKEAFQLTQVNTHQELIHLALQELVQNHPRIQNHPRKSLFELAGQIDFQENYDYKSLRTRR